MIPYDRAVRIPPSSSSPNIDLRTGFYEVFVLLYSPSRQILE
jgi:hypothetical protein